MDNWQWYCRPINFRYQFYLAILILLAILMVYLAWWIGRYSRNDAKAMGGGKTLQYAINSYCAEVGYYPEKLEDVLRYLPRDKTWPVNPYTGQPVKDTGSLAFDTATFPGNVFYERIMVGEDLEGFDRIFKPAGEAGYALHVFGLKGVLIVYHPH